MGEFFKQLKSQILGQAGRWVASAALVAGLAAYLLPDDKNSEETYSNSKQYSLKSRSFKKGSEGTYGIGENSRGLLGEKSGLAGSANGPLNQSDTINSRSVASIAGQSAGSEARGAGKGSDQNDSNRDKERSSESYVRDDQDSNSANSSDDSGYQGDSFGGKGSGPSGSQDSGVANDYDYDGSVDSISDASAGGDSASSDSGGDSGGDSGTSSGGSGGSVIVGNGGGSSTGDTVTDDDSQGSGDRIETSPGPRCEIEKTAGLYNAAFTTSITCNSEAEIYYCVSTDGGCCDPYRTGVLYKGSVEVGPSDGDYCVGFYGVNQKEAIYGSSNTASYIIDSAVPSLNVAYSTKQIQTTQAPALNSAQSNDFGKSHFLFHQINYKSHDVSSWSCAMLAYDHATLTAPIPYAIITERSVASLVSGSSYETPAGASELQYGENKIYTIMENTTNGLFACLGQDIVLKDFPVFSFNAAQAQGAASGAFGGFTSFGHFEQAPNSSESGTGSSTDSKTQLNSGFLSITH